MASPCTCRQTWNLSVSFQWRRHGPSMIYACWLMIHVTSQCLQVLLWQVSVPDLTAVDARTLWCHQHQYPPHRGACVFVCMHPWRQISQFSSLMKHVILNARETDKSARLSAAIVLMPTSCKVCRKVATIISFNGFHSQSTIFHLLHLHRCHL